MKTMKILNLIDMYWLYYKGRIKRKLFFPKEECCSLFLIYLSISQKFYENNIMSHHKVVTPEIGRCISVFTAVLFFHKNTNHITGINKANQL